MLSGPAFVLTPLLLQCTSGEFKTCHNGFRASGEVEYWDSWTEELASANLSNRLT